MAAKKSKNAEVKYYGTGRRKSSVARVYLQAGEGKITVNGRDADEFFPHDTLVIDVKQPLSLTGNIESSMSSLSLMVVATLVKQVLYVLVSQELYYKSLQIIVRH